MFSRSITCISSWYHLRKETHVFSLCRCLSYTCNLHISVFTDKLANLEEALFGCAICGKAKSYFFIYKKLFAKTLDFMRYYFSLYAKNESENFTFLGDQVCPENSTEVKRLLLLVFDDKKRKVNGYTISCSAEI